MTGEQLAKARKDLGALWGLGRPLCRAELGRALRYSDGDPGAPIRRHESKWKEDVPGPAALAVEMFLKGSLPPGGIEAIRAPEKARKTPA